MNRMDGNFLDRDCDRRETGVRADRDLLLRRAAFLGEQERMLVELAVGADLPNRAIARMLKMHPGTLSRRVNGVLSRLKHPLVERLITESCTLQEETREVAIEYFVRRRSLSEVARVRGRAVYEIRRIVDFVRGWETRAKGEGKRHA